VLQQPLYWSDLVTSDFEIFGILQELFQVQEFEDELQQYIFKQLDLQFVYGNEQMGSCGVMI
jgi:hypothetical protein